MLVNTMSSKLAVQLPLLIVQRTVALVPGRIPVTVVFASNALVIVAVPDCKLQSPVPTIGVLADIVKMLVLHCSMLTPASATVGLAVLLILTSSNVDPHTPPLLIVQRKVAIVPAGTPVTVVVALAGVVIVAVPDIKVQSPVPGDAPLPASVKLAVLHRS